MKQTAKDKILATIKGNDKSGYRTSVYGLQVIKAEHPMSYNQALDELITQGLVMIESGAAHLFYYIP